MYRPPAARALRKRSIRGAAAAQEAESRLSAEVVDGLRDAGVFRMAVPKQYGGNELAPAQMLSIAEELSAMDGSTGWVGTLAGANAAIIVPRATQAALESTGCIAPSARCRFSTGVYSTGRFATYTRPRSTSSLVRRATSLQGG